MANYIRLPNGAYYEAPAGLDYSDAVRKAYQDYPEAFGQTPSPKSLPQSGFMAASKAGLASLKSDVAALAGRTGLMDEAAAEKYIQENI